MAFLFLLIAIGYILARYEIVPKGTETILSKLEIYIFIPALVMGTFMEKFTIELLGSMRNIILGSVAIELIIIPLSILFSRVITRDKYLRNIYTYGLSFSNFAFMGNAIVSVLFPDVFLEYLLFTSVLWICIYIWGTPVLLLGDTDKKPTIKTRLKNLINPMFIGMIVGMIIGIAKIPVPKFADSLVKSLGDCMSPIAMLLTGMTIARNKLGENIKYKSIYFVTAIKLVLYPAIILLAVYLLHLPKNLSICAVCVAAMPLGLNMIVIPGALGRDTRVAAGLALVSHFFSCLTIPLVFKILEQIV